MGISHVLIWLTVTVSSIHVECASQPHIIFIVADDLGWNDIGYHNAEMYTPNLDKLASKGVILNSSYVQPLCAPSRSAFLTGYYPFHTGLQHAAIHPQKPKFLPANFTLLPEKLKEVGYTTHIVGKWHLGFCNWKYTPTFRGFDSFLGFYGGSQDYYEHTHGNGYDFRFNTSIYHPPRGKYSAHITRDRAMEILDAVDPATQPLFLYLPFQSAHAPLQVPEKYLGHCSHVSDNNRRMYCGMVAALDKAVGDITTALEEKGFMDNALLIFTTDNGGAISKNGNNHPLRGSKATLWECGTRGVAFVYSENLLNKTGYVNTGLFHAVDWFPTILSLAEYQDENVTNIDGVSQVDMIVNGGPSARHEFVYNIDNLEGRWAIRVGRYKLIRGSAGSNNGWYPVPPLQSNYTEETLPIFKLFDIEKDPTETTNIADEHPVIVHDLKARLKLLRKTMVPAKNFDKASAGNPNYFDGVWSPGWC